MAYETLVYSQVLLAMSKKYESTANIKRAKTEKKKKESEEDAQKRIAADEIKSTIGTFYLGMSYFPTLAALSESISFDWLTGFSGLGLVDLLLKPNAADEELQIKFALIGAGLNPPNPDCLKFLRGKYADRSAFVHDSLIVGSLAGFASVEAMGNIIFPAATKGNIPIGNEKKNTQYLIPRTESGKVLSDDTPIYDKPEGKSVGTLKKDVVVYISGETVDGKYYSIEHQYEKTEIEKARYGTAYIEKGMVSPGKS